MRDVRRRLRQPRSTGPAFGGSSPRRRSCAAILLVEIVVFSMIGTNFLTMANAFEVLRLSVEIGLLAVALTPVITSGGIDLSVGSLMGLSAVVFGELWRDWGLSIGLAAVATLFLGALAGSLNGLLITRGRIPALIVTLGSFSLFRGLAEGLTEGVDNYTNFPVSFLFLGQGYSLGGIPTQLPIFVAVAAAFSVLLHRTTFGRGLMAIGFSPRVRDTPGCRSTGWSGWCTRCRGWSPAAQPRDPADRAERREQLSRRRLGRFADSDTYIVHRANYMSDPGASQPRGGLSRLRERYPFSSILVRCGFLVSLMFAQYVLFGGLGARVRDREMRMCIDIPGELRDEDFAVGLVPRLRVVNARPGGARRPPRRGSGSASACAAPGTARGYWTRILSAAPGQPSSVLAGQSVREC